ncbi:hypothetical protein ABBQ32_009025 [Trebouxia sp. C0010 RCD-2024]
MQGVLQDCIFHTPSLNLIPGLNFAATMSSCWPPSICIPCTAHPVAASPAAGTLSRAAAVSVITGSCCCKLPSATPFTAATGSAASLFGGSTHCVTRSIAWVVQHHAKCTITKFFYTAEMPGECDTVGVQLTQDCIAPA